MSYTARPSSFYEVGYSSTLIGADRAGRIAEPMSTTTFGSLLLPGVFFNMAIVVEQNLSKILSTMVMTQPVLGDISSLEIY